MKLLHSASQAESVRQTQHDAHDIALSMRRRSAMRVAGKYCMSTIPCIAEPVMHGDALYGEGDTKSQWESLTEWPGDESPGKGDVRRVIARRP